MVIFFILKPLSQCINLFRSQSFDQHKKEEHKASKTTQAIRYFTYEESTREFAYSRHPSKMYTLSNKVFTFATHPSIV